MLPAPSNYTVWPCIVPSEKKTEMVIAPVERAFLLREGEEYTVTLIPVNGDEPDYYNVSAFETLSVVASNGVLRFTYAFEGEMEHLIILSQGEKKLQEMAVYSLREDLYALLPLKGDFHGHSYRSDGRRDPAALAGHYREQGYDFFSLTDHNRFYPGGEVDEVYAGVDMGFTRVRGEEVHAPTSIVHIVHVGGKESVTETYVLDRERYEAEIAEYEKKVPAHVPAQYAFRYARAMWATDRIHAAGGLAIFPHPYWRPGKSRVHNVCDEFAAILLKSGMFDAYELIGGMGQVGNNRSVALWSELRAQGLKIPVVGSSDVHPIEKSSTFPHVFTICFAKKNANDEIIAALKQGLTVAVEAVGDEYNRQYRCYGELRLVSYAQFLLKYYFPNLQRLCQGEGVMMRAYAMNEAPAALVEGMAQVSRDYTARFMGRKAPVLPDADMLAFEDKWRKVHLERGPITKGGQVYNTDVVTRQI